MKLDIFQLILEADLVVKFVLLLLLAASIVSWAIIIMKVRVLRRSRRNSEKFEALFWSQKNMETVCRYAESATVCPLARVFKSGYMELVRFQRGTGSEEGSGPSEIGHDSGSLANIERALRTSVTEELTKLEQRVPFLATTGNSAPFIGLFGTVWGIMNSFLNIGTTGATNLAVVAPGIAEALIATAVGLFAAIPAVIGYNYSLSQIRVIHREMENFSNDFLNVVKNQLRVS